MKRLSSELSVVRTAAHNVGLDKFVSKGIDDEDRAMMVPRTIKADADPFGLKEDKRNIFYLDELENLEWDEVFLDLLHENSESSVKGRLRRVCCQKPRASTRRCRRVLNCVFCFSWCHRCWKHSGMTYKDKAHALIQMRQHVTSLADLERITQYFGKREQQV